MTDTQDTANSRIDADRSSPEASPSAGWRETAANMHVSAGRETCAVREYDREAEPVRVVSFRAGRTDILRQNLRCPIHSKDFLKVIS